MRELLSRPDDIHCRCDTDTRHDALVVNATACPGGDLRVDADCRARVIGALARGGIERIVHRNGGTERRYVGHGFRILSAASRFAERAAVHDARISTRARRDPFAAAAAAMDRGGMLAELVADTVLGGDEESAYELALTGFVGPTIANVRVDPTPPADGTLIETDTLPTGALVRRYRVPEAELDTYHLLPAEVQISTGDHDRLADAHGRYAQGGSVARTVRRAVRSTPTSSGHAPDETLVALLAKQTRGFGILEDLFSEPTLSDVFASAPVDRTPLRVRRDDEVYRTNLVLTPDGASALASRLRRGNGEPFSTANPTIDATAELEQVDRTVRAAGVMDPATDGYGFAFRAHNPEPFTVPGLLTNGTLRLAEAALLSIAAEEGASIIVAGARGAGKTTLVGALLWELPAARRIIVIEDTPELPIEPLAHTGRDVQPIRTDRTGTNGIAPATGLHTALRFGQSALVVGEIRGEEAPVLYEAMRVGAGANTVLGTVHGNGVAGVRDRVVTDLGVDRAAFAATDAVVTLAKTSGEGTARRIVSLEEVRDTDTGPTGVELHPSGDGLASPIERGTSELIAGLARSDETYADVLDRLERRRAFLATLTADDVTHPDPVVRAYATRRTARCDE